MTIFLINHFIISSILCYFLIYSCREELRTEELIFKIFLRVIVYCPFITEISLVVILITKIDIWIKNRIKNRKEYLRLLKDRDRKIKLGIIKINKEDPYGEEDWI